MENDLILKNFLVNDNKLNKIEMKLSLDYLKCKIENCYKKDRITHENFEDCKEKCLKDLTKLNNLKTFLYKDFTKFYYDKFLTCSDQIDDDKFNNCVDSTKKHMKKNVDDIKNILLNSFKI